MSARRAYSHDGSDGAYSDDFISDDDRRTHSPYNNHRYGGGDGGLGAHSRDRIKAKGGAQRGRGRGKGRRGGARGANSRASEPISMKHDTVTKRVLSASRNKINELRNQVGEQNQIIKDLEAENKLFKKLQFRQEKAIKHFEDKESDLPRILEKHGNEVRVFKDQNRKLREKFDRSDHYLRDAEDELERVKKRMNKYKDMCEQKELQERDELSRKVTKAEIDMEEKDVKIKELERHMEILKKNHRHELGIEMARQKELKRQMEEMTNKNNEFENQLKEKSKQLEYKNIYSQSITLASQDNASVDQSPSRKLKKRASLTDLTPRDKAKFYEEKRRDEVRKQKEVKAVQDRKKRHKWEKEEKERLEKEKEREKERAPSESPRHAAQPDFNFASIDKSLDERERDLSSRKRYREEQDEYRRQSERDRQDLYEKKKELEKRQEEDRWKRDNDDREQRQREDREREERERKQRDEREQNDREKREREDRARREQEQERQRKEKVERERREKERIEQEKRIQVEKERLDNDPAMREERRKKDELLRKLQDMDKIGNNPLPKNDPESFHSKENTTGYDTPGSKKSDPKEYSFTNPVLNLHKGKPARDDVTVPYIQRQRQKASKDDDEFGYQPSFGPGRGGGVSGGNKTSTKRLSLFDDDDSPSTLKFDTSTTTNTSKKPDKSTNLLENLFGPNASSTTNSSNTKSDKLSKGQDSETFFITGNSPTRESRRMNSTATTTTTSAFPWDNTSSSPVKSNTTKSTHDRGGSSTLFGGGAAVVDDDLPHNGSRALPRRARQSNVSTFSAKPSVTAVDPFDDEIEEVVL